MTADVYDIAIDQGSDYQLEITVVDSSSQIVDLTGYSARGQIRPKKDSDILTTSFVCSIINPTLGKISVSLTNGVTATIAAGTYYYDIEVYTPTDAYVKRILQGKAKVIQEVTR